ncbi:MAG: GGDEF domain-containing protein [Turicibacter sp.]
MEFEIMVRELISSIAILISAILLINISFLGKILPEEARLRESILIGFAFGITTLICNGLGITQVFVITVAMISLLIMLSCFTGGSIAGIITTVMYISFLIFKFGVGGHYITTIYMGLFFVLGSSILVIYMGGPKKEIWVKLVKIVLMIVITGFLVLDTFEHMMPFALLFMALGYLIYILISYIEQIHSVYAQHILQANHDFLTGLSNVRSLDKNLAPLIFQARQNNTPLSALMLDIDYFKKINDTHGHEAGDIVLQELGSMLRFCCRTNDLIIRKGGEEFCIILPHCDEETAIKIAERIRKEVKFYPFKLPSGKQIHATISIGVATLNERVEQPNDLINYADKALYEAKKLGRNRVVTYVKQIQ